MKNSLGKVVVVVCGLSKTKMTTKRNLEEAFEDEATVIVSPASWNGSGTVQTVQAETGNTRRVSASKRWCFTLNNYSAKELEELCTNCAKFTEFSVYGLETGSGTPHVQGYVEFSTRVRPILRFGNPRIHWEKAKGTRAQNVAYCSKEGCFYVNNEKQRKLEVIDYDEMYPWQKTVVDLARTEPDDRTIHWFWEHEGNRGKTTLCKHLVVNVPHTIIVEGKGADMKNAVLTYINTNGQAPRCIVVDIPRSFKSEFLNVPALEGIKNGLFYSGKYEGGMCVYNPPHVIIFSNSHPPDMGALSEDRWNVVQI